MLFPKGPRFAPEKIPDVPGPNFYKLNEELESEAYKRGAFLEKAERFKEKPSEVPGPGTYDTEVKNLMPRAGSSQGKQPSLPPGYAPLKQQYDSLRVEHSRLQKEHEYLKASFERLEANLKSNQDKAIHFASLQRKLEDLEKVHNDGKKMHFAELERNKLEGDRTRKTAKEQAERIALLKKQNEAVETRNQDLKKSAQVDQSDIKGLRHKLRLVEQERDQLVAKQGEASDMKRALHTVEAKRKEEMQERDRKLVEMQRSLEAERHKMLTTQSRAEELRVKAEKDAKESQATQRALQQQAEESRSKARETEAALENLRLDAEAINDTRLEQLDRLNATIKLITEEYGRLASSTVAASVHHQVKFEHASLQMRVARLERKIANSDEQVYEVVNLYRQSQEKIEFLSKCLQEADESLRILSAVMTTFEGMRHAIDDGLAEDVAAFTTETRSFECALLETTSTIAQGSCDLYDLQYQLLLFDYRAEEQDMANASVCLQTLTRQLTAAEDAQSKLVMEQHTLRQQNLRLQTEWTEQARHVSEAQVQLEVSRKKLIQTENQAAAELSKHKDMLKKEREMNHRLVSTVQQNKMAENGMRAEIEQLSSELADAELYQEAYQSIIQEVGSLVDRNALAEEEAERLSKFNAEILGHRNPTQRIFYVDKVRRELADTKQKLLASIREHDAVLGENEALRGEVNMYKSVAVSFDGKPRTNITRVPRLPLASRNLSTNLPENDLTVDLAAHLPQIAIGEMTLDEIM